MNQSGGYMPLVWDDNLLLGVEDIDQQHREIFSRFEKLSYACQEQQGSDVVRESLDYLQEYVAHHFAAEESIMEKLAYPDLDIQREQHAAFRKDIDAMIAASQQGADGHRLSLEVDRRLVQWFILHIRNLDSKLAAFVREKQ
jgi:hemerythrin